MDRVQIKEKAKESLKGNLSEAIILLIVSSLISSAASMISSIGKNLNVVPLQFFGGLAAFVVTGLFAFGTLSFYTKVARGEEVTWKELFNKTDLLVPYIFISILTGLFTFLWSLLFVIPGIIAAISYSQAMLIRLENEDMSAMDCIKASKEMMMGHKMDYFVLNLSFIGWLILVGLTCGILSLYVVPYMAIANVNFYDSIKEK